MLVQMYQRVPAMPVGLDKALYNFAIVKDLPWARGTSRRRWYKEESPNLTCILISLSGCFEVSVVTFGLVDCGKWVMAKQSVFYCQNGTRSLSILEEQ
jgi:hypothetical protein